MILSHRKHCRGEGRKDDSFSSSVTPGNMDTARSVDLHLSMSTAAKGSIDKLLWVLQSDSNKLVMFD